MKNITFGQLLDKLLYLSNQKKGRLAQELGYDVSYISKWINSKNIPTQKNIGAISKTTAKFIVKSLTDISKQELKEYFEMNIEESNDELLTEYLERSLKDAYVFTAQKSLSNICKTTQSQENYNSIVHVNPRLRKQYLSKDAKLFLKKTNKVDIIISANLYNLNNNDKSAIVDMKSILHEMRDVEGITDLKVRILMGFEGSHRDKIHNTMMIINMIVLYPEIEFEIYNCEVDSNSILAVIKDRIFHSALYTKDGNCLYTTMSKEKSVIEEMYYSLEEILKNQGELIVNRVSKNSFIKDKFYIQYIMGQDLRWIMDSMNELFMSQELFDEVANQVFGDDKEIISELKKINLFLQNAIYTSKIKVLIYETELVKYISTGELRFFNTPVKLTLEQREKYVEYIEKIIRESNSIEIKLIEGNFVDNIKNNEQSSIYLSESFKFTITSPSEENNDYAIINDSNFENICEDLFDILWNEKEEMLVSCKEEILERISKVLTYTRIINGNI